MNTADGSDDNGTGPASGSPQLEDLRRRISAARTRGHATVETALLLQDLETAHEELRVADEEVRAQQEHIEALLSNHRLLRWQHERVLSALPVAMVATDLSGQIRTSNAAAAALTRLRMDFLTSKPVFSLVSGADRPGLREDLARLSRAGGSFRRHVTVMPRGQSAIPAEAFVSVLPGEANGLVTWLLIKDPAEGETLHGEGAADLPRALVALTTLPSLGISTSDMVQRAAELCQGALGDRVTLSLVTGSPLAPTAVAATSQVAQELDGAQIAAGQGPVVSAFEHATVVVSGDLESDTRWPRLAARAHELHVGFVVAAPITTGDVVNGALSVYGALGTFPAVRVRETTQVLAAAIAAVLHELGLREELESLVEDMRSALESRATIDQAKGIIMAGKHCSADEAFQHLVELSSTSHMKLREVAAMIVAGVGPR
ncbi:MAG: ANTAR domain-containing protein [Nocardioidaceae bacterium]|nr:ANTAR domain-containing protein [Nocardioidaceae bacterium]